MGIRQHLLELQGENQKQWFETGCSCCCWSGLGSSAYGRNMNSSRNTARLFYKVDLTFAVTACIPVLVEAALGAHLVRRSIFRDLKQNLATLGPSPYCLSIWQRSCQHFRSYKTTNRKQLHCFFRFRPFEKDRLKKTVSQWSV